MKTNAKREIIKLALLLDDVSDLSVFIDYDGNVKNIVVRAEALIKKDDGKVDWDNSEKLFRGSFYVDFRYAEDHKNYEEIRAFLQTEIDKRIAV